MVDNLSVDVKTQEDSKFWKIRSWLENLRQNFLKVSPEKFNSAGEIMLPFKEKIYLRKYLPNKPHKWGFKIWRRSSVSGFINGFDVYRGCSNKENFTFSVSGNDMANLCFTLPKQENHKMLAVNFFTHSLSTRLTFLSLTEHLKSDSIWYTKTSCTTFKKLSSVS